MIRFIMSSFGTNVVKPSRESSAYLHNSTSSSFHAAAKANLTWANMEWNESLADMARSLIFGEKKYTEFTLEEQKIVDIYQEKKLEEDAVILPNTRAALEEAEIVQILLRHNKKDR